MLDKLFPKNTTWISTKINHWNWIMGNKGRITIPENWKQRQMAKMVSSVDNAMMDEHPWRAFCRRFLPRVGRLLYCRASFTENWTRFFVFLLLHHPFVPLHRRWIGGSSKQTACEIALDVATIELFIDLESSSPKWKTLPRFRNKRKINRLALRKIIGNVYKGFLDYSTVCWRFYFIQLHILFWIYYTLQFW